jgi:hypothetical protein
MSSTGSPDPTRAPAPNDPPPDVDDSSSTVPAALLILGVVLVLVALIAGVPVIGALYALIAPPEPPVPAAQTLIRRWERSTGAGIEERLYGSSSAPCDLIRFYTMEGTCEWLIPDACAAGADPALERTEIAVCYGSAPYSGFAQRWRAVIAAGYEEPYPTRLRLASQRLLDAQLAETPLP